ncbi:hypothetical protein BSL78_25661 [Apostichopus japonicus]|uniref:Reverse transcriptase RNase H-like domain-containing protein n=1 Tax=Stichopus japonicus TaxID=307972 RepID=A0A2G8JP14_STIJA|nr:hypothetical protein BSL78_25661 [Apostichopus japonicus]
MAYPDFKLPFILHTDASNQGLASVLYQRQEGKLRAIAFASRTLSPAEKNYHSNKLEFLALKWSITDRFRDYLQYAVNFTVFTDNNPLTYVLTTARLNATGQRWVSELASFRFNIKYRPGKRNNDADTLSRMPINVGNMEELVNDCVMEIPDGVIAAAKECLQAIDKDDISCIDAVPCSLDAIETVTAAARPTLGSIDVDTLKAAQENDDTIGKVLEYKRQGHLPKQTERRQESKGVQILLGKWKEIEIDDRGLLQRRTINRKQLLLPEKYRKLVLKALHNDMGHVRVERTLELTRQRFFWPYMAKQVEQLSHLKLFP